MSAKFGNLFESYDPELAKQIETSLNEKVTDILSAIEEILINGFVNTEVMKDVYAEFSSMDEAIETMYDLLVSIRHVVNILFSASSDVEIVKQEEGYKIYRLSSAKYGNMLMYIRPQGSKNFNDSIEYGRQDQGVEASINFKINPLDPFSKLSIAKDSGAVSIRLDREGITESEPWDSPLRDPTRNEGMISLDVSSQFGNEETPEVRIGRLIAAGNKIRCNRGHTSNDTLHHTSRQFNQSKFGTASGFDDIAQHIMSILEPRLISSALSRLSNLSVTHA